MSKFKNMQTRFSNVRNIVDIIINNAHKSNSIISIQIQDEMGKSERTIGRWANELYSRLYGRSIKLSEFIE